VRDEQLVGYVLAATATDAAELVAFLGAALPAYMVPATWVFVAAWPLTPNGKIDRAALPAPVVEAGGTAPLTRGEELVAKTWAEVLGRTTVGRDDNFFELGGHSLLAAQVISRLKVATGIALSVRTVFDQPTVAGFARELAAHLESSSAPRVAPRVKRRTPRPEMELVQPN